MRQGENPSPRRKGLFHALDPEHLLAGTKPLADLMKAKKTFRHHPAQGPATDFREALANLKDQVTTLLQSPAGPEGFMVNQSQGLTLEGVPSTIRQVRLHHLLEQVLAFCVAAKHDLDRLEGTCGRFTRLWISKAKAVLAQTPVQHVFRDEILMDLAEDITGREVGDLLQELRDALVQGRLLVRLWKAELAAAESQEQEVADRRLGFLVGDRSHPSAGPGRTSPLLLSVAPPRFPTRNPGHPNLNITITGAFHG